MEHRRLRKYRGPETWAQVREAYLRGEPGPALARRFDVGLANLRKKAREEGWTRRRHALEIDPPSTRWAPRQAALDRAAPTAGGLFPSTNAEAVSVALAMAAEAILAGRKAEAIKLVAAAETLSRLYAQLEGDRTALLAPGAN